MERHVHREHEQHKQHDHAHEQEPEAFDPPVELSLRFALRQRASDASELRRLPRPHNHGSRDA